LITAGLPAINTLAGTLPTTTDPAAIILLSPICTPFKIIAPQPIHTLSPIITSFLLTSLKFILYPNTLVSD